MIQNQRLTGECDESKVISLYHLDIFQSIKYLKETFSDVKVVCMGGKASRMRSMAKEFRSKCKGESEEELHDFSAAGGRFSMFMTNNVLFLSHGMGIPSISIALDEVTKMLHFAGAKDVVYIRVGTCGGLGLDPGSIVVTEKCFSPQLEENLELFICGKSTIRPAIINKEIFDQFLDFATKWSKGPKVIAANTLCANTFYEEQARMDGCACTISREEQQTFFEMLVAKYNIRNIEMESLGFASYCHSLAIKGLVVAVILVDRMVSDHITMSPGDICRCQDHLIDLVLDFMLTKI